PATMRLRSALLRSWPTAELTEMIDLYGIMRTVLERYICPSNGTVIHRHKERYGEDSMPIVGHLFQTKYYRYRLAADPTCTMPPSGHCWEGWGDDVGHYYILEDMLKLHPGVIYQLYDFCAGSGKLGELIDAVDGWQTGSKKSVVESHIAGMGEWFIDNGQTLAETIDLVVSERGEDEIDSVGAIVFEGID
ncbi:MAG: hypothetical protein Q9207_008594, partial [Kuettlingeria erythrocarpa]